MSVLNKISKNKPDFRLGAKFYGNYENIYYCIQPIILNEFYGSHVLGAEYHRNNLSYRFENSFIQFYNNFFALKFGRMPIIIGQSPVYSLIRSIASPSTENLIFEIQSNKKIYELALTQLASEFSNDNRIKRYISSHKIRFNPKKNMILEFGEMILYTGENRSVELSYLNPFIPYVNYSLEGEEDKVESLIMKTY